MTSTAGILSLRNKFLFSNKDIESETIENKEKLPGLDLQAEVTQQKSPPGKQQMTEEEQMVHVQEITNTVVSIFSALSKYKKYCHKSFIIAQIPWF